MRLAVISIGVLWAGIAAAQQTAAWNQPINVTGSGMSEQQAKLQVLALCQGEWGGWNNTCQAQGGRFDSTSDVACFRFAATCSGFRTSWTCTYFTSVTCAF